MWRFAWNHQASSDEWMDSSTLGVVGGKPITSYDVCALFTCIPPKDALAVVRRVLDNDNNLHSRTPLNAQDICELLSIWICLTTTYFSFKGQHYIQLHGCAMGSPVSPIVVNLYMEHFEATALNALLAPPRIWLRYVDDTFVILNKDQTISFFDHINSVDSHIKFTQEPADNNQLAFLDCKISVDVSASSHQCIENRPIRTNIWILTHTTRSSTNSGLSELSSTEQTPSPALRNWQELK